MDQQKKIVLFDIDYTLFDADLFRDIVYKQVAEKIGRSYDQECKIQAKESERLCREKVGFYDPEVFLDLFVPQTIAFEEKKELLHAFFDTKTLADCLYQDVVDVLQSISLNEDVIMGILSTGENTFQRKKIDVIRKYFMDTDVHIFPNKIDNITQVLGKYKQKKIYVIDDSLRVLSEVKKKNDACMTIQIIRKKMYEKKDGGVDFSPDAIIESLKEVISIIHNS